jgi:hypothetical protein
MKDSLHLLRFIEDLLIEEDGQSLSDIQQGNRMLIEFSNSEELGLKFDGQLRL